MTTGVVGAVLQFTVGWLIGLTVVGMAFDFAGAGERVVTLSDLAVRVVRVRRGHR